jgi:hypothetical protein
VKAQNEAWDTRMGRGGGGSAESSSSSSGRAAGATTGATTGSRYAGAMPSSGNHRRGCGRTIPFPRQTLTAKRSRAVERERRSFDRLIYFLNGFKAVWLNTARGADLFEHSVAVPSPANMKIGAQVETFRQIVLTRSYMYILLAAVVFVAPISALAGWGVKLLRRRRHRCS